MMKLKYYELDEEKLLQEARKGRRVAIKMPEGLQPYAHKILKFIKENGIDASLLMESCYGACDFVERSDVDRIICIGEAEMPYLRKIYSPPVSFIEVRYNFNEEFMEKVIPFIEGKKVGMASITPFLHMLERCTNYLIKRGYEVKMGKMGRRTSHDGQILGCDLSSALMISDEMDEFIFIGDGFFHPIGLYIATGKNVIVADPISRNIYKKEVEKRAKHIIRKRYAVMTKAMECKKVGIIVSRKVGQRRLFLAKRIKKVMEERGKEAFLVLVDEVNEAINYLDFDCYISTACPRIAIDDSERYKKPILTPVEAEIIAGERKWENYEFDQIL